MTHDTDTDTDADYRESAEVDDSSDDPADWAVLPPTLTIRGEPDERIEEAVRAAIEENPNCLDAPILSSADEYEGAMKNDHAIAYLSARYNEIPVSTGDGPEEFGWVAPYRAREEIDAVLHEALPKGIEYQAETNSVTGFYEA